MENVTNMKEKEQVQTSITEDLTGAEQDRRNNQSFQIIYRK